jgi:hypothetical protein
VATASLTNSQNQINLTWVQGVPEPAYWEIQLSSDPALADSSWIVVTDDHPGVLLTYSITGLAAETTYYFRVRGLNATELGSGWSNVASASTDQVAPSGTCEVQSAAADPGSVRKKPNNNNRLDENVRLTVNTVNVNSCGSLRVEFETSPGNTKTLSLNEAPNTDVYSNWIYWNTHTDWSVGNKIIRVIKNSTGAELAQISLVVTN